MYARTNEWMMDENTTNVQERSQMGELDCKIKQAQKYCTLNE
jgi:hypothetical protein